MELNPLDLLEASRRWLGEFDELSSIMAELRELPVAAFTPSVRDCAATCADECGAITAAVATRVEQCAEGLRHTAELGLAVDAEVAAEMGRLGEGCGR